MAAAADAASRCQRLCYGHYAAIATRAAGAAGVIGCYMMAVERLRY